MNAADISVFVAIGLVFAFAVWTFVKAFDAETQIRRLKSAQEYAEVESRQTRDAYWKLKRRFDALAKVMGYHEVQEETRWEKKQ